MRDGQRADGRRKGKKMSGSEAEKMRHGFKSIEL
jgi:hypothetical protein